MASLKLNREINSNGLQNSISSKFTQKTRWAQVTTLERIMSFYKGICTNPSAKRNFLSGLPTFAYRKPWNTLHMMVIKLNSDYMPRVFLNSAPQQAASFKSLVEGCDGKNVVLQVDFSENATIASQREIQSAHWNHGQATLFTAHVWIKAGSEDTGAESKSMVTVSDDLNHTKYSIIICVYATYFRLPKSYIP